MLNFYKTYRGITIPKRRFYETQRDVSVLLFKDVVDTEKTHRKT